MVCQPKAHREAPGTTYQLHQQSYLLCFLWPACPSRLFFILFSIQRFRHRRRWRSVMTKLSQSELCRLLDYDPETGVFRWAIDIGKAIKSGRVAGTINGSGYVQISINRKLFRAHRLAWLYMKGTFPAGLIDHIDGNRTNNSISNLREVSPHQNALNRNMHKRPSASGVKCVNWCQRDHKWLVKFGLKGVYYSLGRYEDLELAELVAREFREKYHGQYARH